MAGTSHRTYRDQAGFMAALEELTDADLLRLRKKAALYAPGTGLGGDDLLQEAILRTLEAEGRNCPEDVPVAVYLGNAMRSIADGERDKYARQSSIPVDDYDNLPDGAADIHSLSAEEVVSAQDQLGRTIYRLETLFADDPPALAIVIGDMEEWSATEIKEAESMDDKEYATARRRVRRTIEREFGGGNQS